MSTRKTILAVAATAALGLSALGTTPAAAWGFHGFHSHVHFSHHYGYRYHWNFHRFSYRWRYHNFHRWNHSWYRPFASRYRWNSSYRPYAYGAMGAGVAAAPAMQQPAQQFQQPARAPANCLVKQYVNGSAVFQDVCTQETAVAPAAGEQPGSASGPGGR
jgi:hypothetical protein